MDAGIPVMMAGSIKLAVLSQLRLCETPVEPNGTPMWFTLEVEEEEEEEVEFGRPPKLMLIFGRSARSPSCHSFTFKLSTEPLFSDIGIPPRPVLWCWAGMLRSKKWLCTAEDVWFKCVR